MNMSSVPQLLIDMRNRPRPQETAPPGADWDASGVCFPALTARNKVQAGRNEIQAARNKIQAPRNKIQAKRNEIQMTNRSDSSVRIKTFQCVTAESS
jgi:hypothetical protein